jgi:ribosome-binding factor A
MQGSRPARVGEQIREELSELLTRHVKDPGIGFITLTHVKVSPDLQVARVFYTTLGDDKARKETAKALDRATPFLRRQIAGRLRLRRAPELTFQFDESIARQQRIEQLIEEIHATDAAAAADVAPAATESSSGSRQKDEEPRQ